MKRIILLLLVSACTLITWSQAVDSLWSRGLRSFHDENYHGMIAYMDSVVLLSPLFSEAYYNRGLAKIITGSKDDACFDFQLAMEYGTEINKDFIEYQCNPDFIRNLLLKQFYTNVKVYPENGFRPRYTRADTLRGALRFERTCFDVKYYDLKVRIIPSGKKIQGQNSIYFEVIQPTNVIQIDLFDNFKISEIIWNDMVLEWHREFNALFITFPEQLKKGDRHTLSISYRGKPVSAPNPPWDGGFVWKKDKNKDLWLGVACEQLGASSWWPNKDHLSDKPDSMQITLEIPAGYQAVSNGDLRRTEKVNNHVNRFVWFVEYPINNYNVTFYVGKYTSFGDTLIDGKDTLRMDYNVLAHNLDTAREHFRQTREVLAYYNKAFGFYPFAEDGFGLVESPYEGMEHQTAIAYGHGYKKNNEDYRNSFYDYIIVHEAAHEWWGNSVTAKDMADVWIHEGFATYAELMFLEDRLGRDEYYYELIEKSRYIFNVWPMVHNRDVNEDAFASNDVYNKGAMMLHCLRSTINNDSVFFDLVRDFCVHNKYKTLVSQDFIDFANNYTGADHTAFFKKFLYETGLPVLEYNFRQEQDDLVIRYRWSDVEKGFSMPFGIGTNVKKSFRLFATTEWQETRIPETRWFNFYTIWKDYEGVADNSLTYFYTRRVKS